LRAVADGIEAFCQTVRAGLATATFAQWRPLAELLIDRVIVTDGDVEIRYVLPTSPDGPHPPFCQLRKDHLDAPQLVVGADHELSRGVGQVGRVAFNPASPRAFASRSWFTDFSPPARVMNQFRLTGTFQATAFSAFVTCSSMPRRVRLARSARYW